ncbi:MAG: sigma-54-dependent Fis family transcriptional regulator, partial [Desulfuromonadaceae bacterium]|nr:sigma-54-dependent Fis family transcriptional regulator [Desulfuromonadaceae bacterium]
DYDLALVDIMLAGDSGIDVLQNIKRISPRTLVVMFTGRPEVNTAAEAVRLGAFDYITKPVQPKTLLSVCRMALNEKKMSDERERYRVNMDAIFSSVSDSIIMIDVEGRLEHFNAMAGNVCGYTGDLIGSKVEEIEIGCGGLCRAALMESLRTNTPKELRRFECNKPRGNPCIVSFKSTPIINPDGTVRGAVAVIRDETHMVDLERSLQKRAKFQDMIGLSDQMQRVYSMIEALADVPTTVMISGESGTGKELVAAALHHSGGRAKGPFVKVNCSGLSESLLESELFGHVRGAFTGAIADKVGRFQKADRGTLFLDEIGDISPAIQMRLLRVLQEREFERVGESTPIKVDIRIIAATNKNLAELVSQGTFRQDLYFRLDVVRLTVPPLRERLNDLPLLINHFIRKSNKNLGRDIQGVSDDVVKLIGTHCWPGNVRELEHTIEHASILCKSDIITLRDLPPGLIDTLQYDVNTSSNSATFPPRLKKKLTLEEALEMSGGNRTRAAKLLGVTRLTVYRQLKKSPAE